MSGFGSDLSESDEGGPDRVKKKIIEYLERIVLTTNSVNKIQDKSKVQYQRNCVKLSDSYPFFRLESKSLNILLHLT